MFEGYDVIERGLSLSSLFKPANAIREAFFGLGGREMLTPAYLRERVVSKSRENASYARLIF